MRSTSGTLSGRIRKPWNVSRQPCSPSALFSVSLAAHGGAENAESYVQEFEQQTGWRPAHVALFGGALLYSHYGFIKRLIMKKIAGDNGSLDTDTSRDYVYTEWDGVKRFAEDFLATL
jgi:menaquinone-dependent protoporphyrinogen oxidase